ncbi:MAG: hypothetical protein EOP34_01135 [Rickettsiales bacterium]|nr:MAG: hypothetical protein EOP34_01135 [Rickettsiales bacterium]
MLPLFPIFLIFFIGSVAETNRAPFDLAEAESELVSGFMTEHAAVIFVFFFLAEYASIVLMCLLVSILFLGGYNFDFSIFAHIYVFISNIYDYILDFIDPANSLSDMNPSDATRMKQLYNEQTIYDMNSYIENILSNPVIENLVYALVIGIKTSIMIFVFI